VKASEIFSTLTRAIGGEWRALTVHNLQFTHRSESWLLLIAFAAFSIVLLAGRFAAGRRPGKNQIMVPAVLGSMPRSAVTPLVHIPLLLFLTGLPFLGLALADPHTPLVRREATYPGRRICLTIDASNSMTSPFQTNSLATANNGAFFTTVAAAERFVQMRKEGQYRDLLALVEFGANAYVVTPFTTDYDNLLVSLSLIGDPREFSLFPDQQTLIGAAIDQSVQLFRTFKFLDAAGNLLICAHNSGVVSVHAPDGKPLSQIAVEDRRLTNCCFGDVDFQTLYITESGLGRVVTVRWERPGLRLHDH